VLKDALNPNQSINVILVYTVCAEHNAERHFLPVLNARRK